MTNSDHSIHRPDGAKNDSVKVPRKNFMNNSLSITAEKYSAVKKLIQHKFSIHIAIKYASLEIEQKLREKIISIKRVKKAYGSNANSFFVKTTSVDGTQKTYFLKFGRNKNIDDELKGDSYIQGTLRTPKIVLSSKSKFFGHEWILYEHVHGRLMNEVLLDIRDDKALNGFFDLERQKEASLSSLYYRSVSFIDYKGYIESMANRLFYKRLVGNFYKEFYERGSDNISSLFDRVMIVNNKRLPLTINQIIDNIKRKYHDAEYSSNKIRSIVGHGDAHHGNIIVEGDIWFIDNEYADITTPFMELAKPYYNDFLGDLFFHQHELLNEYFKIISYKDTGKEIHIEIVPLESMDKYFTITKIKLDSRKDFVNKETEDFISLNDYLFLCHILTKNPNDYPQEIQKQFLVFAIILSLFDPFNPRSFYSFFKSLKYESCE